MARVYDPCNGQRQGVGSMIGQKQKKHLMDRVLPIRILLGLILLLFGCTSTKDAYRGGLVPVVTLKGVDANGKAILNDLRKDPVIEAFISQHGIPNFLVQKEGRLFFVYTQNNLVYAFEKGTFSRTYKVLYAKAIPPDIRSALPLEEQTHLERSLPLYQTSR